MSICPFCPCHVYVSCLCVRLQLGHAYDAQNREVPLGGQHKQDAVKSAKTALELYRVIGCVMHQSVVWGFICSNMPVAQLPAAHFPAGTVLQHASASFFLYASFTLSA